MHVLVCAWLVIMPGWGSSSGTGRAITGAALEASKLDGKAWEAEGESVAVH